MDSSTQFTLMEGKFNREDATSIVLNFFNTKIMYHNQQLLRMGEQGNNDHAPIDRKISELNQTKQAIINFLAQMNDEGQTVEIEGAIRMKMSGK